MIMKYVDHQLHPAETLFHIVAEAQFNRIGSTFIHFLHIGKIHIRFIKLPILTKDLITSHLLLNNAFKILFLILALDECPQPCCLHNMAAFHIYLCMGHSFRKKSLIKICLFHIFQLYGTFLICRIHEHCNCINILLFIAEVTGLYLKPLIGTGFGPKKHLAACPIPLILNIPEHSLKFICKMRMDNLFSDPAFRKILFPDLISRDHLTLRMEINGFLMLVVFKDLALKTARQKIRPFQIADDPVIPLQPDRAVLPFGPYHHTAYRNLTSGRMIPCILDLCNLTRFNRTLDRKVNIVVISVIDPVVPVEITFFWRKSRFHSHDPKHHRICIQLVALCFKICAYPPQSQAGMLQNVFIRLLRTLLCTIQLSVSGSRTPEF